MTKFTCLPHPEIFFFHVLSFNWLQHTILQLSWQLSWNICKLAPRGGIQFKNSYPFYMPMPSGLTLKPNEEIAISPSLAFRLMVVHSSLIFCAFRNYRGQPEWSGGGRIQLPPPSLRQLWFTFVYYMWRHILFRC